jgi:GntR family transcriptional regulator
LAPGIGEHDYGAVSLYQLLRDHRVVPSRADYDIEAGVTDATRSKLLGVRKSSPVLLIRATTFDREGRCIELSEGAFLGERYRFTASVSGPADDAKSVR